MSERRRSRRVGKELLAHEERLVRLAVAGDPSSFLQIYDAHAGPLYRYAFYRLRDRSRAEDLVQEVFLALLRRGRTYHGRAPLSAFLFRIAHNRIANFWRDQRIEVKLEERAAQPGYDDALDLSRALARLPAKFREPLLLAAHHGLSYQEVAEVLECPVGTIRSRIARAKRRMLAMLRPPREGVGESCQDDGTNED